MSMSTGDVTVSGNRVEYVLRIPIYEIAHTSQPDRALLEHVRFAGGHLQHQQCFPDGESYVCAADYLFDNRVETLDVSCTLYAVTVPNHVHVLRARKGNKEDQAFFDYTFTSATLRFEPPTPLGIATRQTMEGAFRGVGGAIQLLFLFSLAMAARTRRELFMVTTAFVSGLIAGAVINWHPPPRFAECAAALSIAYLAVEILFLPRGGLRWLIAAALGVFQGLYLALFASSATPFFIAGAALADVLICAFMGLLMLGRVPRFAACLPLAAGLTWFFVRLRA
jgi:hypothetical protein